MVLGKLDDTSPRSKPSRGAPDELAFVMKSACADDEDDESADTEDELNEGEADGAPYPGLSDKDASLLLSRHGPNEV